ncbi:MAG: DUF1834 family protein [Methylibium sp.]
MAILTIEDALIARIKSLLGNKVRGVESLPGDWDDDMLKRFLKGVPGVFLAFAGGRAPAPGAPVVTFPGQWIAYVATGHASGEAARRRGDSRQAGAYELSEALMKGLHNFTVPAEGTVSFVAIENLFTGQIERQGVSVYAVTFQMPMTLDQAVDENTLDTFETFDVQWDVPPHDTDAEHRKWLGGDTSTSRPDAHDTVGLPQT